MYTVGDAVSFVPSNLACVNTIHRGVIVDKCLVGGINYYTIREYGVERIYGSIRSWQIFNKKDDKEMKKSDLKNRMVVETRNGNRYMVVDNFLMRKDGYLSLSDYNEDLTMEYTVADLISCNVKELDIMKIYSPYKTLDIDNVFNTLIEIWERDETKEIKFSNDLDFAISVTDYLTAKKEHGDESAVIKFDLK